MRTGRGIARHARWADRPTTVSPCVRSEASPAIRFFFFAEDFASFLSGLYWLMIFICPRKEGFDPRNVKLSQDLAGDRITGDRVGQSLRHSIISTLYYTSPSYS